MSDTNARKVIFDTDPGYGSGVDADDPLALMLILGSPELDLLGVTTTYGNISIGRATETALRVLEATGRSDVPVAMGSAVSLDGILHPQSVIEYEKHDRNIGPVDFDRVESGRASEHAVDFIVRIVNEHPGDIDVIAVGPLTNVATAMLKDPTLPQKISRLTILGGAYGFDNEFGRGNVTPTAEYNIWHDPLAARIVFESGVPMTAVGLDVCNPVSGTVLTEDQLLELVAKDTPFTEFLYAVCKTYIEEPRFEWTAGQRSCLLYDAVAVASVIDPSLVKTRKLTVFVETSGDLTKGQTIPAVRPEHGSDRTADVCVDVDGPRFVNLFVERLKALRDGIKD